MKNILMFVLMAILLSACEDIDYVGKYRTQLEQAGYSNVKILNITYESVTWTCGPEFKYKVTFTGKKNDNYVKAFYCVGRYEGGIINILQTEVPSVDTVTE